MFCSPESIDFRGIANGVDHIMLIVFDLRQNALGKNIGAVFLAQFVADFDEQITSRIESASTDLVTDHVGKGIVVKTLFLQVASNLALAGSVSASKSYQHFEALRYYDSFSLGRNACLRTSELRSWAPESSAKR